ncbi:stress-related protein-like [Miscanthus floridulus]|uniref:stress-related protein-like n=1 Tax=Miscanthus floridulus TaxID=154761 RepID=UPI00345777C2
MAEEQPNPNPQPQQAEEREVVVEQQPRRAPKLRYLDFVQVAAAQAAVYLAGLYGLAKDHAGPLRPGVDAVESTVKGVVGPVYARFGGLPLDVLAFVDRKVDDTVHEVDKHLPGALKAASARAYAVARGVPEVARELAAEAQQSGVKGAARAALAKAEPVARDVYGRVEPVARDLYVRYEPAAEHLAVSAWRSLNGLPVFPHVAQIVVPTAAHWAEKYNRAVVAAAERGYAGAKYLPAIPTERIAKVFSSSPEAEPLAESQ